MSYPMESFWVDAWETYLEQLTKSAGYGDNQFVKRAKEALEKETLQQVIEGIRNIN